MTEPTITIDVVRLSVEIAELQIRAEFQDDPGPDIELRGRLMGPRCPGVSTVEIAYPIKSMPSNTPNILCGRVLIPEPNMWTEQKPLTYWGYVEVWRNDEMISSHPIDVGLRKAVR